MKIGVFEKSIDETARQIARLADEYRDDVAHLAHVPVREFFSYVSRDMRYIPDPKGLELVMRPRWMIERGGGDCDDKTVMVLAWFHLRLRPLKLPFGYALVSKSIWRPFHHVFPFFEYNNQVVDFDATYAWQEPFVSRSWASRENVRVYAGNA